MEGFEADEAYASRSAFFQRYLFGYQLHRLECYDRFLRRHLRKDMEVLSIGSGRCANELFLMEDGYSITCSDLKRWGASEATKVLFPHWRCLELDILAGPAPNRYEAILCLGVMYLFDDEQLLVFYRHVAESLRPGGHLILDCPGAPDHALSFLLHDLLLKYEVLGLRLVKGLARRRLNGVVRKHHGYRRTDREVVEPARRFGLVLRHQANDAFTVEFQRSRLLRRLMAIHPSVERAFGVFGRSMPSVRMFDFEKLPSAQ